MIKLSKSPSSHFISSHVLSAVRLKVAHTHMIERMKKKEDSTGVP